MTVASSPKSAITLIARRAVLIYSRLERELEIAQQMANRESARLYDQRDDQLTLDEVERIFI